MNTSALYHDRTPQLVSPGSRWVIFLAVVVVHALLISLPYLRTLRPAPVKENMFKVKLGSDKPSHDVNVGKPERTRPTGAPPSPHPPAEPKVKIPPKKVAPPAEPKVRIPPKPKVRPKVEPKVEIPPKTSKSASAERSGATTAAQSRSTSRQSSARQTDTRRSGGNNFNNTVPIGSRNAGQRLGKPDHRTPQGGLTEAEEAYYNRLKKLLDFKWVEPSRTHLGDLRPQATIELEISPDGRVLGSKIVKASGNVSMDESVRRLLKVLDRVPPPPNGAMIIHVNMEVK